MGPNQRVLAELVLQKGWLNREQIRACTKQAEARGGDDGFAEEALRAGLLTAAQCEELHHLQAQVLLDRRKAPRALAPAQPAQPTRAAQPAPALEAAPAVEPAPAASPACRPKTRTSMAALGAARKAPARDPQALAPSARMSAPPPAPHPVERTSTLAPLPPRAELAARGAEGPPLLERALKLAAQQTASDLHAHSGMPLVARQNGRLLAARAARLDPADMEVAVAQVTNDATWRVLDTLGQVDFALAIPGLGRFRANVYRQHRGMDAVFRLLPERAPTLKDLGLPDSLARLVDFRTGLVLCTGPSGSGKSTTLAALLDVIVQSRRDHVLTVEQPIEIVFSGGLATVTQREVGLHTSSFARALRAALREDPDVIAITELRDRETIGLALTAAETGHLVLGTLHTSSAVQTIARLVNAFPAEEQEQVRATLSESLRAVVSQRLVPRVDGNGRVVAHELLLVNTAIANMIREGREFQLGSLMQTGKAQGMVVLDDSLTQLLQAGVIDKAQARRFAESKERFR